MGVESNRAAIGARIKLELETEDGARTIFAHVNSGGSFGASSLEQEIGLGQASRIMSVEVRWPASGEVQVFTDVPLDAHIEVREGEGQYTLVQRPRIRLGQAP